MNVNLSKEELNCFLDLLSDRGIDEDFISALGTATDPKIKTYCEMFSKITEAINFIEDCELESKEVPYPLSENQKQFIEDCILLDLTIDYNYSGRGMFGKRCPSVILRSGSLKTSADISQDSMGFDRVFYCPH